MSEQPFLAVEHQATVPLALFETVLREQNSEFEVASYADGIAPKLPFSEYAGIFLLGGTPQVDQLEEYPWLVEEKQAIAEMLDVGTPIFGICLGGQLLSEALGGEVGSTGVANAGWLPVKMHADADHDVIFSGLGPVVETVVWHKYGFTLPPASTALASTPTSLQAFKVNDRPVWGVQFHPEAAPETLEAWMDKRVARGAMNAAERDEQTARGVRLRATQLEFARHLCGRFIDIGRASEHQTTRK